MKDCLRIAVFGVLAHLFASAAFAAPGTSAEFKLDLRSTRDSAGDETLTYSSLWDGGNGATVTIAQDGVTLVQGLTGEGNRQWSVTHNGTYVLTHTTYTNGVAGKVETATFVVTGKDVPFAQGDVTVTSYSNKYDGAAHGITVQSAISGFTAKYSASQNGTYTSSSPTRTDVGSTTVWCEISAPGYITQTNSATVTVSKRAVALTSGSASKVYDGTALTKHTVTVGGDGFVSGEGATYTYTGSQTEVGSSANNFSYTLKSNTKASNYEITKSTGTLTVELLLYSVKFNKNGGSGTMANESFTYGTAKALTANAFTRAGYAFVGWMTSANGTTVAYADGQSVLNLTNQMNATVNLYAKWTDKWYVNAANGNDANQGDTVSRAFKTIQHALDKAVAGMTIIVADGTYAPIRKVNLAITIQSVNGASRTTIDGGYPTATNRCVYVGGSLAQTNTVIRGFTIQNGCGDPDGAGVAGGTLYDCVIRYNHGRNGGGAVYSVLYNCIISDNDALQYGGGVCKGNMYGCIVTNNVAHSYGGGVYGGMAEKCVIVDNQTDTLGGGAHSATIYDSEIRCNKSTQNGAGAYYCELYNCILANNESSSSSGGAHRCQLENCLVYGNRAKLKGGGIINSTARNCTIYGNTCGVNGGGAYADLENGLSYGTNYNCIVFGNTSAADPEIHSSIPSFNCYTNDPHFIRADAGDFRLRHDSPCINAGNNAYVTNTVDFAGNPRIVGGTVDIGAYEFSEANDPSFTIQVANGTGSGTYYEGDSVTIVAADRLPQYGFTHWSGDVSCISDANSMTNSFTMPAQNLSFTAEYEYFGEPFADGDVTVSGYSGKYDGAAHGITVQSSISGFVAKYCASQNGTYTATPLTRTDVGSTTVWCEISAPGYITQTNSATVTVSKRSLALTSGSASKVYDGTALVKHSVAVSGDGFVSGEGATYSYIGSQTVAGSSANGFIYTLNSNTKAGNYTITTENGTLTVSKAANSWTTQPSIAGWTYGQAANAPNLGAAKFGNVQVSYSATPQNAGSYTATFTVPGTSNYSALSKSVPFVIAKATYDMSGAHWDYAGEYKYDGTAKSVYVSGLPSGVTATYTGNTATAPGTYTAHATLAYDTENYNKPEIADLVWVIKSAEETTLREVFDDLPAIIEPDGDGGWKVTITNDIDSADLPIEIPDNLGPVTIDLGGHDIVGENGVDGDDATPGGNGIPAIVIVAGDGDGEPTVLTIVTSGGDSSVKGGDGGAGNPGGDGAPAIEVADGAQDGVVVNIGTGVTVRGGDGGASNSGCGGDGGAGIVGNVGTNDGTIVGGDGGDSGSGDGGNGGSGVDGNVGTNNGDISGGDGGASEGGDAGGSGEGVTGDVGENNGDILPYSLTDEMVGAVANQPFTGVEVKPAPTVYDGVRDKLLEEGVDYVLAWKDNVRPGTATIIVTGMGSYRGEVSRDFAIMTPVEFNLNAGEYFKATLAELGYDVPTNGVTPYSVVAKGLPAGLKLKYNPAWKNKKGKITKKAKVEWWIEGVPTAAMDFFTNPPYLVITANGKTWTEALPAEVLAQNVVDLGELSLGQSLNEQFYLPGVTNGWTVSGLPKGLKYTAKRLTEKWTSGKKTVTVTKALPYSVYGKTTKAGRFTITAKKKVGAYYETMKYRVLVTPKAVNAAVFGEELTNITTMAYVPVEWDLTGGGESGVAALGHAALPVVASVAKVAGLPSGVTFAAKDTYAYTNPKKKTGRYLKQAGQTIVGTPKKSGTYVVTFTKNVTTGTGKSKKTVAKTAQILWTVTANDAELELAFNTAGGVIEGGTVGLKYGDLMSFSATDGATVTASGLPAGITLANLGDGSYAFRGFTTKAGTYLVTVKATLKGKTVTQRVALKVDGLPSWARGTFNGYIAGEDGATNGLATITVSSVGKISGKFQDGGTNWTFSAASFNAARCDEAIASYREFGCSNVVAKHAYKVTQTVKGKKKTVTKYLTRTVSMSVSPVPIVPDDFNVPVRGRVRLTEVGGSAADAWQNLWGSTYKAVGKKLFYTSAKKPYRVFTIKAATDVGAKMGLLPTETLSLKVTPAGAVAATMSFDTGKMSKGKAVIYKATCATMVIPLSAAVADEFAGEVFLYFAPSPAKNFPGFAGAAPF